MQTSFLDKPATDLAAALDAEGHAVCQACWRWRSARPPAAPSPREALYRSTMVMARHGCGRGAYRDFADPLPPLVARLREALYPQPARSRTGGTSGSASRCATPRRWTPSSCAATAPARRGPRR